MAINKITNTPVFTKAHNHWGLIQNNMQMKNCIRQSDGTLWALVWVKVTELFLIRSTDNGFSWEIVRDDIENVSSSRAKAGLNGDGPFAWLVINEEWNILDVYQADYISIGTTYDIERRRYDLDTIETDTASNTTITTDIWHGNFAIGSNAAESVCFYVDTGSAYISAILCSHSSLSTSSPVASSGFSGQVFNLLTTVMDDNSVNYLAWMHYNTSSQYELNFATYDKTNGWSSQVVVEDTGGTTQETLDIGIAFDGYGNLCIVYTIATASTTTIKYATSTDSGATWDVNALTRTSGHTAYQDLATSDYSGRTTVIGGSNGGFMMAYTELNSSGVAKTYVRQITTSDGVTYTLGDEKEIATNATDAADKIVGLHFFHPNKSKLIDLSDPGQVRVCYTIGDGSSTIQTDLTPVTFGQELLSSSAYPSTLDSETGSYSQDVADSDSVLVSFILYAGPNSNEDYYTKGLTGNYTTKYINAFNKTGTAIRLKKYEPKSDNQLSDRSSYGAPTETVLKVLFDPMSYSFPIAELTPANQTSYIEQDVRKIYLPPTQHLSRTFVVNDGGFLKRTVWLCEYDGNEYEISQVVPRFISNQIAYYEANAYVVGPSRNPFSRTILPSET